jgi:hypothetical protein
MAPQSPRHTEGHSPSGLLARTHGARTHRSRVPRCGAGPPVLTGPPAPASRSPSAHSSGSHSLAALAVERGSRRAVPAGVTPDGTCRKLVWTANHLVQSKRWALSRSHPENAVCEAFAPSPSGGSLSTLRDPHFLQESPNEYPFGGTALLLTVFLLCIGRVQISRKEDKP